MGREERVVVLKENEGRVGSVIDKNVSSAIYWLGDLEGRRRRKRKKKGKGERNLLGE